jgi:uncharacterized protein YjiS (DUF1127 family)
MNTLRVKNFSLIEDLDIAALTFAAVERIEGLAATVHGGIKLWVSRSNERRQLGQMSHRMLDDIGLTIADVDNEVGKHFWQK